MEKKRATKKKMEDSKILILHISRATVTIFPFIDVLDVERLGRACCICGVIFQNEKGGAGIGHVMRFFQKIEKHSW
jgi:hypothetical protein